MVLQSLYNWMENSIVDEMLLLAILIAILEIFAQNNLKNSLDYSLRFLIGLSFYIYIGFLLHYAYHKFPLSKVNIVWSSLTIILSINLGYFLYDEDIDKWSIFAMIFALFAIGCTYMH